MVLLSALKPACSSATTFFRLLLESVNVFIMTLLGCLTDKVYGSGILKLLQVAFL